MPEDNWARVEALFDERDRRTTEEHGCPLSLRVDGDVTCERAVRPRIELAKLNARVGAVLKTATPLLLPERRSSARDRIQIDLDPQEFHELRSALDQLRGDE